MDRVKRLKLSNDVSMKILKNDYPINGKVTITIVMENNEAKSIEVKNTKKRSE